MGSRWKHGCGQLINVLIPRGWDYVARERECGSTSHDGGINQCEDCFNKNPAPAAREDETDEEYDERFS